MSATGFYPILTSRDVPAAVTFYRQALGFEVTFESDWYVSLRLGAFELAIMQYDDPSMPEAYRALPRGVILSLEVDDVDAVHARLTGEVGLTPIRSLRDESFGQRHFIVTAPDDVLLDVIQPIAPSAEYADSYAEGVAAE
ncbi:VOC family protein [Oerskovia turbata]